jgi:hypothetical protein
MPLMTDRKNGTPRWLVELASDWLSDDELEALDPLFLARATAAPEEVIKTTLAAPRRRGTLRRTA